MTSTACDDQFAPEPDPVFESEAAFYAWTAQTIREATTPAKMITALDRVRRVKLAHLHLREEEG